MVTRSLRSILIVLVLATSLVQAQWRVGGNVVCDTADGNPIFKLPKITTDDEGGAYVCWHDLRNGTDYDIYAQHIDSSGMMTWEKNGIPIVQGLGYQDFPRITEDGRGGAFIAWEDDRGANTFVYAQRVNKLGEPLWILNGVKASEMSGLHISIDKDSRGGLLLAWNALGGGTEDNVFVQRLDSLGNRVWGDSGVRVTNRPGTVYPNDVAVVSDGSGGAIVTWTEGSSLGGNVYTQRVDSSGQPQWEVNGILLSDSTQLAFGVAIVADTKGGAIINWNYSDGSGAVQRITSQGQLSWRTNGVPLTLSGGGGTQRSNSDDKGGALIGSGERVHHLDSMGQKIWGDSGVSYITRSGSINSSQVHDGHRGIFNFTEYYSDSSGWFILAQWIDSTGAVRFGPDGVKVTPTILTNGRQFCPNATTDGKGGALACWNDNRDGNSPIYIARVDMHGVVTGVREVDGEPLPAAPVLKQNYPNPFNPTTTVSFVISHASFVSLRVYDVLGRVVATLVNEVKQPGEYSVRWNAEGAPSGLYFCRLTAGKFTDTKKLLLIK